jgi:hypothetical protein
MAILSVNGLDTLSQVSDFFVDRAANDDFSSFTGTVNYLPTDGVLGGGALQITSGAYIYSGNNSGNHSFCGWFKVPSLASEVVISTSGTTTQTASSQYRLVIKTDGSIVVYDRFNSLQPTLFPAGSININTYYYVAVYHNRVANGTGSVTVKINNVSVTASGRFDNNTGNRYYFLEGEAIVDDLVISLDENLTLVPPQIIYTLSPSANGTPQDFSFTGGASAWESIDEKVPDNDTSYISSGTIGHKSQFAFEDLPAGVTDIKAIQGYVVASRETGTGTNNVKVTALTSADGSVVTTTAALVDGTYTPYSLGKTETAYTPGDVNGMKIEFEVVA